MCPDVREPPEVVRAALERLPIAVLIVGTNGAIALVNGQVERLFGYDRAELIGQSVNILLPDGWWPEHVGPPGDAHDGRPRRIAPRHDLSGRRKDGSEVSIELGLSPMTVADASFVVASVTDITERRRIEGELRALRDERLQFETLVGELGAEFVNVRADDVDRAIEDALGRVVRMLDLDRSALFQVLESGDFVHTHQWTRPGWAAPPPRVSASEQFPWHLTRVRAGELVAVSTLDDVPNPIDRDSLDRLGTRSTLTIPLTVAGRTSGALTFATVRQPRSWTLDVIARLRVVALIFTNALARKQADEALRGTITASAASRARLQDENAYLRHEVQALSGASALVGHSPAMRRVLDQVRQVAGTDSTVLLLGETGTGKSLLAARIHEVSGRSTRAMVRIHCATLTGTRLDSELFGRDDSGDDETGPRHAGRFELANHSTIYLDEVADLPLEAQASLLRFLQDEHVRARGPAAQAKIDVRIVAATRKDLMRCVAQGTFRDDLYFHLNVFPIHVPPLRDRREDIPLLVWRFVDEFSEAYGKPIDTIDKQTMAALRRYAWPGNARELRNVVERAMIIGAGRQLRIPLPTGAAGSSERLAAIEREHITAVLTACDWQVRGKHGAAARLGLTPRALETRMAELRIRSRRR